MNMNASPVRGIPLDEVRKTRTATQFKPKSRVWTSIKRAAIMGLLLCGAAYFLATASAKAITVAAVLIVLVIGLLTACLIYAQNWTHV
jgi:K+-sensing histidine kinase KdpD